MKCVCGQVTLVLRVVSCMRISHPQDVSMTIFIERNEMKQGLLDFSNPIFIEPRITEWRVVSHATRSLLSECIEVFRRVLVLQC